MNRIHSRSPAMLPMALILVAAFCAEDAAGSDDADVTAVTEKVLATMRAAVESSPEIALRASRLGAEVAEIRSSAGAGAPTLSWQREGIGAGFDQRPNAVDHLRVNLPFNPPWRRGASRRLQEATGRLLETGSASSYLEVEALAGQHWLDLAAETEMAVLAETRVERLHKALATQTRRYELGEISGSERRQLELELARDRVALRQAQIRRLTAEQKVTAFTPSGFPLPVGGDLSRLVEHTASPVPGDHALEAVLAEVPFLRLAEIRREVADAEAGTQRHSAWGRPEVELEWARIPDLGPVEGFSGAGVRVSFPLPLGKQGREKILATQQRAQAAAAERERLHRQLLARLNAATETAQAAEAALESLRATADQSAASEHSLAEQFRLGAISYLVYLDGLSRLDEVRRGMIETRYTLLAARLELAQLLGTDTYFPMPSLARGGS